jgi:uncharacterized protein YchJ
MKLLKKFVLVVAASLMMTACGGGGGATPSDVAKSFNEAMLKYDFAAAKQYVAKDLQETYAQKVELSNSPEKQELLSAIRRQRSELKFEIISERIEEDGNTATVKYKSINRDGEEEENYHHLVKEDGQWKVTHPTEYYWL